MTTTTRYDDAPSHYLGPQGIECWDAIDSLGLAGDYYLASAFAYLWRYGKKDGADASDDVRKAYNFLGRWLENQVDVGVANINPEPSTDELLPSNLPHEMTLIERLRASIKGAVGA